jgi:2-hydroxy-3-keto-5-methylthiopentenyl-1-phosphate phosphatase
MATIRLPPDFKEFLKLLKEHDVRYLLIGAYAVNYSFSEKDLERD